MFIKDITPRTGLSAVFEASIEPRRIELAKLMGTYRKIEVVDEDNKEIKEALIKSQQEHVYTPNLLGFCECVDCAGDYSHAGCSDGGCGEC